MAGKPHESRGERFPTDPSGIQEPHDVLAAEEFAMPAPGREPSSQADRFDPRGWLPLLLFALAVLVLLRRRS